MAFILIPTNGEDTMINAWNWRPTLELLRSANLINDDLYDRLGTFGREGRVVDAETANRIAEYLDQKSSLMKRGDRIRADLTITDVPKMPIFVAPGTQIEMVDAVEAYSATYEWLAEFRNLCKSSEGFEVSWNCQDCLDRLMEDQ